MLKLLITLFFAIASFSLFSFDPKSICRATDDRVESDEPQVGRLIKSLTTQDKVCTMTMISNTCGVSAGHCKKNFGYVEFNVPPSSLSGLTIRADKEDIYKIDLKRTKYAHRQNNDWAVVKVMPNEVTGLTVGEKQGFLKVNVGDKPVKGDVVRITGYGFDQLGNERNFAQKTHRGEVVVVNKNNFLYQVDTTGGNSGSAVVNEENGEIVGIHTHGGCLTTPALYRDGNRGTLIYGNKSFIRAIKACLASERVD